MTKVFLDTNIWLRYFVKDNKEQYEQVEKLLEKVEEGQISPYVSAIVLLEIYFGLKSVYGVPKEKIVMSLTRLLKVRNLTIIEVTKTEIALGYLQKYNIKFSDCLIASQIPKEVTVVTFDEELFKIREIHCSIVKDFLASIDNPDPS